MSNVESNAQTAYSNLEKPIEDARHMSQVVASMMDDAGGVEAGDVKISRAHWEMLSFAVHHLDELVANLHGQYHRD